MSQTLLIADQDQDSARTLAGELAADGYPVATASAIEALGLQLIDRAGRGDRVAVGRKLARERTGAVLVLVGDQQGL